MFPRLSGPLDLQPGRLNVIGPAAFSTGGVVSNTGLTMHRLGIGVRLVGKVGDDLFGRVVRDAYRELDPRLADCITVVRDEATSYTIVINPPQHDRVYLHCSGANETFEAADVHDEQLASGRLFHFGYPPLMPRMYADGGAHLRRLFERARTAGLVTSLDMCVPDPSSPAGRVDWGEVLRTALPAVDVFAPSIDELLFMVDRPRFDRLAGGDSPTAVVDHACLIELTDNLLSLGSAVAAIKLGNLGLYLRTAGAEERIGPICGRLGLDLGSWCDRELLAPCFEPREILGTTGSGDATIGGLLMAMLRGASAPEAATVATAVGACSVEAVDPTSGIPTWAELADRLESGWRRREPEIELGMTDAGRDASGTVVLR